jgi:transcriptional regulator with XRE-family HTH domain
MDMRKLVGKNVKRIRQSKGLTQEQFADASGFSQQYISSLESGRRNPTVITVYELAHALGVSHLDLLAITSSAKPTRQKAKRKSFD